MSVVGAGEALPETPLGATFMWSGCWGPKIGNCYTIRTNAAVRALLQDRSFDGEGPEVV